MADWLDEFSTALEAKLGNADLGISDDTKNALLDLARDVAHASERKNAPLATFLAGRYVGARVGEGADAALALGESIEVARLLAEEG